MAKKRGKKGTKAAGAKTPNHGARSKRGRTSELTGARHPDAVGVFESLLETSRGAFRFDSAATEQDFLATTTPEAILNFLVNDHELAEAVALSNPVPRNKGQPAPSLAQFLTLPQGLKVESPVSLAADATTLLSVFRDVLFDPVASGAPLPMELRLLRDVSKAVQRYRSTRTRLYRNSQLVQLLDVVGDAFRLRSDAVPDGAQRAAGRKDWDGASQPELEGREATQDRIGRTLALLDLGLDDVEKQFLLKVVDVDGLTIRDEGGPVKAAQYRIGEGLPERWEKASRTFAKLREASMLDTYRTQGSGRALEAEGQLAIDVLKHAIRLGIEIRHHEAETTDRATSRGTDASADKALATNRGTPQRR